MTDDLVSTRIKLSDPAGVIAFAEVDTYSDLPESPASQTAYRTADKGIYYVYDTGVEEWEQVDLQISDTVLMAMLTTLSVNDTARRAINIILAGLYCKRQVVRTDAGAESTQYQSLTALIALYNALKAAYKEESAESAHASTGRIVVTTRPTVGGFLE
jgi:hypothetical protein